MHNLESVFIMRPQCHLKIDGEFLNQEDKDYPKLNSMEAYPLVFVDSLGLITEIAVYEEGYASMECSEKTVFLVQMDETQCQNMIEMIQE